MEDGNLAGAIEDGHSTLTNKYTDFSSRVTTNGHDLVSNANGPRDASLKSNYTLSKQEKTRKRINPLKIHLGKRPFIDNSTQYQNALKRKSSFTNKLIESNPQIKTPQPRIVPKQISKKVNKSQLHNVSSHHDAIDCEEGKPVPRLVPKSQLLQFKKGKTEKSPQLKEYTQYLGLQPMMKFKCRKCCAMFKTLTQSKEHQQICRAQTRESTSSSEAEPVPSRVTRKVYLCSACGTYYENWNLFLHMKEVHNRHICLFCMGMFSKAEKLSWHLTSKHNVIEYGYSSKEDFCDMYNGTFYLMCCSCDEIYSEQDNYFNHDCNNVKPKPVPVLVSKNANSAYSKRANKNNNDAATNGPMISNKEPCPQVNDLLKCDKDLEPKNDPIPPLTIKLPARTKTPENNSHNALGMDIYKESNSVLKVPDIKTDYAKVVASNFSPLCLPPSNYKPDSDLTDSSIDSNKISKSDDCIEPMEINQSFNTTSTHSESFPVEKEKDCGIKLKLSLNKANSPVIINSTVDPTIGKHNLNKPPLRYRRPPKRYEKEALAETPPLYSTPTIKMTICDRALSPFVKTTIFDNKQDTPIKSILNNNLESTILANKKSENTIKSTIYDNKPDEINTLNRVPKLTVRLPKELLDKDSSSDYSSDSDVSDKLTVDEKAGEDEHGEVKVKLENEIEESEMQQHSDKMSQDLVIDDVKQEITETNTTENTEAAKQETDVDVSAPLLSEEKLEKPSDEEVAVTELSLDKPLDKYPLKDLLKVFLASTVFNCIYCNHVRKIAVNCEQLSLHMVAEHKFAATVDSITAEELLPETITAKVKAGAPELSLVYINLDSYDSVDKCEEVPYDQLYECFQCYFKTPIHKDLYFHNRKMHQKTILLCVMCKTNFYSYSELLCHLCPGTYDSDREIKFRCCLCNVDSIPSSFRLMVHLRKIHHTCDVCLEVCFSQSRLSNHVWKHKLHHLCYRCGIAYRNKPDITKHLFWKHGTESVMCKKCLQKKWPHVYHFCTPPPTFVCEECSLSFSRAVYLKVHKRLHSEEFPHVCEEEGCTDKFVSKKLLLKHSESHMPPALAEAEKEVNITIDESLKVEPKEEIPVIDLENEKVEHEMEPVDQPLKESAPISKKSKKKKIKDRDLLLDVNLPALNLSESDSDESDSSQSPPVKEDKCEITEKQVINGEDLKPDIVEQVTSNADVEMLAIQSDEKTEIIADDKPNDQQVLDIWDNFKKYQAKVEKQKTPPLVPIKKHVCESDHDYCLIPTDLNGEDSLKSPSKKAKKKSMKKKHGGLSSSSSSSSDSDSSCSCGSNCSCSSSSGSSSSSSTDSDSSDSGKEIKKKKHYKKTLPNRRTSCGSQLSAVDVMGLAETPVLIPEKLEPPIAESDLDTEESETDEEFYDEYPQRLANKILAEKRNKLLLLASVAPSDNGSISGEISRSTTPVKEEEPSKKEKLPGKKKVKKKKKSKTAKKTSIKINIPKEIIAKPEIIANNELESSQLIPNKITISLQSQKVQIPNTPVQVGILPNTSTPITSLSEKKRASKRRRVPNKFYGYSSDEEATPQQLALKPQLPPKLEWRKEDLPSPITHKTKKEVPSAINHKPCNYTTPIRLTMPIPDPEPPRILMNSESLESNDSDSSNEGALEIYQPTYTRNPIPVPPPHLNSGTSSLPYPFVRPPVRQARAGESVYCYCRCPYDEVSEMIACDADGCTIEWFHFECVGIMVPPKGKWYCPECRKQQTYSGFR